MKISINNVPDSVHAELSQIADENKRTIAMECLKRLEDSLPRVGVQKPAKAKLRSKK